MSTPSKVLKPSYLRNHSDPHSSVRKVTNIKYRYNPAPHLTQNTTWESDRNAIKHPSQTRATGSALSEEGTTRQQ